MKVSFYIVTYNKNKYLPNTLFSIARQKPSFDYDMCIVDDCSDEDPEPIIRNFFPNAKYLRLEKHTGFMGSYRDGYKVIPDNTDILIMQSDDVVHLNLNTIETLCKSVKSKVVSFASVRNAKIPFNDWKNNLIVSSKVKRKHIRGGHGKWYFFLGAALKKDMDLIGLGRDILCDCDTHRRDRMKEAKFSAVYPPIEALHQIHPFYFSPCPLEIASKCKYLCKARPEGVERLNAS